MDDEYSGIDTTNRCRDPHPTEPGRYCLMMPGHVEHHGDDFGSGGWWPQVVPSERVILQDLIAELRGIADCDIDLNNQTDPETLVVLLDRAEARLREVQGEHTNKVV